MQGPAGVSAVRQHCSCRPAVVRILQPARQRHISRPTRRRTSICSAAADCTYEAEAEEPEEPRGLLQQCREWWKQALAVLPELHYPPLDQTMRLMMSGLLLAALLMLVSVGINSVLYRLVAVPQLRRLQRTG